jgi:hypothetical protein
MSTHPAAVWHRLEAWRDDAELDLRCRSCGIPIRVGDTYRVAGIYVLCTLRPFCPAPAAPNVTRDQRRTRVWKHRRRVIVVGRPQGVPAPIAVCRCGESYRQQTFKGRPQRACSRSCTYLALAERAAAARHRRCIVCLSQFTYLSSHPTQEACSPSCGARLREQRKRLKRSAA